MRTSFRQQDGYTLMELAIVILVVGLLIAPAFGIYTLYMKNQREEQTQFALSQAENALGGFRSLYGRYPCPADPTLSRYDPNYGYESNKDCSLAPSAGIAVTTSSRTLSDPYIWIGSLPFRTLNMQETSSIDGYGSRLTYAVMKSLTSDSTYDATNGGISIVDFNDNSFVSPPDSAQFVVISHGQNNDGAYSREGALVGTCGSTGAAEGENCDNDNTFRLASPRVNFDDRLLMGTPIGVAQWQYSSSSSHADDIHLVSANSIALGDISTIDFDSAANADIRLSSSGDAVILASTGGFRLNHLCTEDGSSCFKPESIGGHSPTGGLYCPPGEFIVSIENGNITCASEVWFSCPPGKFVAGFTTSGHVICDVSPSASCANDYVDTTCGDSRPITGTYSGGTAYAYSGDCKRIQDLTSADYDNFATATSLSQLKSFVDPINSAPRTTEDCGDTAATAQVRDTFTCDDGSWSITRAIERLSAAGSWSSNNKAETNYGGSDNNNTNNNHDCWCREDYRARRVDCADGYTGDVFQVQEHICPQTEHDWTTKWTTSSTGDFCACNNAPVSKTKDCDDYFPVSDGALSGQVTTTTHYACDASGTRVLDSAFSPNPSVTFNCTCENKSNSPKISTVDCPTGFTNSFNYDGNHYDDVKEVYYKTWECPNGFGQPANSASLAGSWSSPELKHSETCNCDSSTPPKTKWELCSDVYGDSTLDGKVFYKASWDCTASPPKYGAWVKTGENCRSCSWTKPTSGDPYQDDYAIGEDIGEACTCYTTTTNCHEKNSSGNYDIYNSCSCLPH